MIKLNVIGHLGKDCSTNAVNGKNVINFSVAHSERFKDASGNLREKTVWVDCAYWTEKVGIVPYLRKGQQVFVEGIPDVKSFTRQDGTPGASMIARVLQVQLIGMPKGEDASEQEHALETANDSLPF
jgi:single-strand DNA-binding protein